MTWFNWVVPLGKQTWVALSLSLSFSVSLSLLFLPSVPSNRLTSANVARFALVSPSNAEKPGLPNPPGTYGAWRLPARAAPARIWLPGVWGDASQDSNFAAAIRCDVVKNCRAIFCDLVEATPNGNLRLAKSLSGKLLCEGRATPNLPHQLGIFEPPVECCHICKLPLNSFRSQRCGPTLTPGSAHGAAPPNPGLPCASWRDQKTVSDSAFAVAS